MKSDIHIVVLLDFAIFYMVSHLQCSFAGEITLPPTDFVKQFSVTHDKSFVVIYLPNEGDNSQGIIDHSRM